MATTKAKVVKSKKPAKVAKVVEEVKVEQVETAPEVTARPDKSNLDEDSKIQSLVTLLQQIPPQYLVPDKIQDSVYAIARFVPTEQQLELAKERIKNPVPRFPVGV